MAKCENCNGSGSETKVEPRPRGGSTVKVGNCKGCGKK